MKYLDHPKNSLMGTKKIARYWLDICYSGALSLFISCPFCPCHLPHG